MLDLERTILIMLVVAADDATTRGWHRCPAGVLAARSKLHYYTARCHEFQRNAMAVIRYLATTGEQV